MDNSFIIKVAINKVYDEDIAAELVEICNREHSRCNEACPVYNLQTRIEQGALECPAFKNGTKMLQIIRTRTNR